MERANFQAIEKKWQSKFTNNDLNKQDSKKICKTVSSCNTTILENSAISQELITSIVRKAALLEKEDKEKK